MRINKYLASAGMDSRRKCETLVTEGRVKVNGKKITELGYDVNLENDTVTVDGVQVKPSVKHIYIMVNKPKGFISTTSDEKGRKTVMDLVTDFKRERLFPVGRLDYDTEGLLLMTTDGDFANRISHPRNEIPKTYVAKIEGELRPDEITKLRTGVMLDGVMTKKCKVKLLSFENGISKLEIVITEGKNRQVRRMFEQINREVIFLRRSAVGTLKLGGLTRGTYRHLKPDEVSYLKRM